LNLRDTAASGERIKLFNVEQIDSETNYNRKDILVYNDIDKELICRIIIELAEEHRYFSRKNENNWYSAYIKWLTKA